MCVPGPQFLPLSGENLIAFGVPMRQPSTWQEPMDSRLRSRVRKAPLQGPRPNASTRVCKGKLFRSVAYAIL